MVKVVMVLVLGLLGASVPCRTLSLRSGMLCVLLKLSVILAPILRLVTPLLFVRVMGVLLPSREIFGHRRFKAIIFMRRWMKVLEMNSQEVPRQPC